MAIMARRNLLVLFALACDSGARSPDGATKVQIPTVPDNDTTTRIWRAQRAPSSAGPTYVRVPTRPWPVGFGPACPRFIDVSTALSGSCAVCSTGDTYCWGDGSNHLFEAGEGPVLKRIESFHGAVKIATVGAYACALFAAGGVRCLAHPFAVANGDIALPDKGVSLGVGSGHACALLASRQVACWGDNDYGQLAVDEPSRSVASPLRMRIVPGLSAEQLSVGASVSCAVDTSRHAWCWGWNGSGLLALGHRNNKRGPQRIGDFEDVVGIATNGEFACLQRVTGDVLCWGDDAPLERPQVRFRMRGRLPRGRLVVQGPTVSVLAGDGTITTASDTTKAVIMNQLPPVAALAGSDDVTCIALQSGELRCWGRNDHGFSILSHAGPS
jgi:alpha-tubulin suppressor-like RCC1 family protein